MITKRELGWFAAMLVGAVILSNVLPRHSSSPPPKAETEISSFADVGKQNAWIAASQISIKGRLKDPDSAEFRNVHFYSGGKTAVACGEVNAKNSFGGYSGYERFVAAGPTELAFLESDLSSRSEMDKVWKELCVKAPTDKA
ncbi:hypothetical protein ATE67_14210 [Sphingopyxis sp. H050]|jgi:hypothetical protein|uniref:hypothetical protein n=1 Tax=Sphingopyxis sp. H050 TaxID=1759072 RepID=UPI00073690AD|nr:hypothetical protein [Sphingopyxis sp. H050]KTE19780.1 hypothetical protein ATE67_14210 [Sphingopyxis sp. H050]